MIFGLLVILLLLWVLGFLSIPAIPDLFLFTINGHTISMWNVLTFLVLLLVVIVLPSPFREISLVLFILWILATLGVIGFIGFPSLILIAVIAGIIIHLFRRRSYSDDL